MKKGCDPLIVPQTRQALLELRGRGPIIVGPWLSEVGFELMYWIPFLRWAVAFAHLKADDLWIVSRGGCRSWYADISPHYIDVLDFYTPDQFRAGNARRMAEQETHAERLGLRHGRTSTKQQMSTAFDREILARVEQATGVPTARVLHPSMMYRLFRLFWLRRAPSLYAEMTTPQRISAPPALERLPQSYVAAKFYASQACAHSPIHAQMIQRMIRTVAETTDIVLLHTGTRYDDHGEFSIPAHPRIHRVALSPATNLETQTAVLARASAYIGTYGGFAYLAPFLGVKAQTFYARPNFRRDHRQVLDQVCERFLRTSFTVEVLGGDVRPVTTATKRRRRAA